MGKNKFVKSKASKKCNLRKFVILPYGFCRLTNYLGEFHIETEDICPRCRLRFSSRTQAKSFLEDLKRLVKEMEQDYKNRDMLPKSDDEDESEDEIRPEPVSPRPEMPSPIPTENHINEDLLVNK